MIEYLHLTDDDLENNPKPYMSAKSWVMMNQKTKQILFSKDPRRKRQVASLTKIMTFMVVLDFIEKHKMDPEKIIITILEANITYWLGGTSADLIKNDKVPVSELFYGMMLPSGNDAAQTLGVYFGNLSLHLMNFGKNVKVEMLNGNLNRAEFANNEDYFTKYNQCLDEFYKLMNEKAQKLGMTRSHFNVAHGMHHDFNYSTAEEIAKLSCEAMKRPLFREVVNTQYHEWPSKIKNFTYKWQNTNFLLDKGFQGCKTGITPTAGPCLSAFIETSDYSIIIVVLEAKSMESRWFEVPKLV